MNLLLRVLVSGAVGAMLFVVLLMIRPVSQKLFSKTWHYYSLLVPIVFLLGGAMFAGAVVHWVQDLRVVQSPVAVTIPPPVTATLAPAQSPPSFQPMVVEPTFIERDVAPPTPSVTEEQVWRYVMRTAPYMLMVWAFGVLVFVGVGLRTYLKFRRMALCHAAPYTEFECNIPVVMSRAVHTPMLIGFIKPVIVLPQLSLNADEIRMILTHEMIHFKRKDILYKMLGFIANAVHWYMPIAYVLNRQLNILCELSCDEKVASEMNVGERKIYGETILQVLQHGQNIKTGNVLFATSFCNSKKNMKRRLINMMHAKKTKKRVAVFSLVIATLVVGIGFAVSYAGTALQVRADNVETYRDFDFDDHDPAFYVEAQPAFTDAVWVEAVPAEAEDEDDSDSSNAPSVTREAFVPPVITVLPSPSQRHEIPASALSMEDAAQIGALYIWDMFGVSIDGMYVQMHYSNHERGLRPVWSGRVVQTREGLILESDLFNPMFSFNIDADTGMRIDIIYHGLRARDVLSEDELETFRRVMPMPEEIEMRNAWFDTILDILTPEEIAFYTEEARAFAQRHFNNSTVVDVQLGYEQIRGPFPSPVFDEQGNIASLELGGFVFTVTDDTGRVAEVTIPSRSGLFRYSDIRTNQNDVNPDFVFEDDGYGVG